MREITHKKGILRPNEAARHFTIERYVPTRSLSDIVEHYWIIRWNMGSSTYESQTVTYPAVNIVFSQRGAIISGIDTHKFSYTITGEGVIAGILFKPAGFSALYDGSMDTLTNRSILLSSLFKIDVPKYLAMVETESDTIIVRAMEEILQSKKPVATEKIMRVNAIVDRVMNDATIIKVADILQHFTIAERTLQHLFKKYVGVSPKWVIMRYRIQEAAHLLSVDNYADWTEVAINLGYSDQAHFIHDFKKTIGQTPSDYAKGKYTG